MKQELAGALHDTCQRESLDLEPLERHVPGPHGTMRKFAGRRILADAETEFPGYSRSGNRRSDKIAAESEQPSVGIVAGVVRDDSDMISDFGAVRVAHGCIYRLDAPTNSRQCMQCVLERLDQWSPGTRD